MWPAHIAEIKWEGAKQRSRLPTQALQCFVYYCPLSMKITVFEVLQDSFQNAAQTSEKVILGELRAFSLLAKKRDS